MTTSWRSFGGTRFALRADARLGALARRWLGADGWRAEPAPPGSIAIRLTGSTRALRCVAPSLGAPMAGPAPAVLGELEYRCVRAALDRSRRPAAVHAALVAGRESSTLLVGEHANGKTTLALALAERGQQVLGDDIALVDAAGRAEALPRPLRIRLPSLRLLPAVGSRLRARAVFDRGEQLVRADAACARRPPRVADVVFVGYRPAARCSVRRLSSGEAIPEMLRQLFRTRASNTRRAQAVAALLASARAWRFEYGVAPARAAAYLHEAVRRR